jgi:hypothetical protein
MGSTEASRVNCKIGMEDRLTSLHNLHKAANHRTISYKLLRYTPPFLLLHSLIYLKLKYLDPAYNLSPHIKHNQVKFLLFSNRSLSIMRQQQPTSNPATCRTKLYINPLRQKRVHRTSIAFPKIDHLYIKI